MYSAQMKLKMSGLSNLQIGNEAVTSSKQLQFKAECSKSMKYYDDLQEAERTRSTQSRKGLKWL